VLPVTKVNTPRLNTSQRPVYSIYLLLSGGSDYIPRLFTCQQSPIQILTWWATSLIETNVLTTTSGAVS